MIKMSKLERLMTEFDSAYPLGGVNRVEPLDPNDRLRQKTQTRADVYPYDKPVSYGSPRHTGTGGDERQVDPDQHPPVPKNSKMPLLAKNVWERLSEVFDNTEIGPQSPSATPLGYGNHGRMGEDGMDAVELELDSLKIDFKKSYEDALPTTDAMRPQDLFGLLTQLDPDFAAETFAPEDEEEMRDVYGLWASKMSGREEQDED